MILAPHPGLHSGGAPISSFLYQNILADGSSANTINANWWGIMMKHLVGFVAALCVATPALAVSYSVGFGAGGAGKISQTSFSGFNGSLGTLTQVDITLSGTTTYDITLPMSQGGGPPPSGTVTYDLKDGLFLYAMSSLGNLTPQPYVQQSGSGTGAVVFGNFQATTTGLNELTTYTDAGSLAKFINADFSGYISVDDPFSASIQVNGSNTGLFGSTIAIASKSVQGTVTYTYTPLRGAVPEPATWATMLIGFGGIGGAMRRNRKAAVSFS